VTHKAATVYRFSGRSAAGGVKCAPIAARQFTGQERATNAQVAPHPLDVG